MDHQKAQEILESLRTEKMKEHLILKQDFMAFREELTVQKDKSSFVGNAQKGGNVIFTYKRE